MHFVKLHEPFSYPIDFFAINWTPISICASSTRSACRREGNEVVQFDPDTILSNTALLVLPISAVLWEDVE